MNYIKQESEYALYSDISDLGKKIDNISNVNIVNSDVEKYIIDDISKIEGKIKKAKKRNFLNTCIKNIRIFGRMIQRILPYVLICGSIFGAQVGIYDVPFYPQDQVNVAGYEVTLDNRGNENQKVKYDVLSNQNYTSSITTISKWEKKVDGKYYRTIKEYRYDIKKHDLNWYRDNINDVASTLKDPSSTKHEVKESITEEEAKEEDFIQVVYSYTDQDDIIIKAQGPLQNITFSILYLMACAIGSFAVVFVRKEEETFDYRDVVNDIKGSFPYYPIDEIEEALKTEKIKFEFVKHPSQHNDNPNKYNDNIQNSGNKTM